MHFFLSFGRKPSSAVVVDAALFNARFWNSLFFIFYILFSVRGRLKGTKIVRFEWMAQSVVSKTVQRRMGVRVKELLKLF